jgi:hypothetical protein
MLLFIRGSAHSAFSALAHACPCLSLLTPSPTDSRGPCVSHVGAPLSKQRRADRARRGRAAVGTPPIGRTQAPRRPHAIWHLCCRTPPLWCPPPPLKRSHRPPADLFLPRAPFVSPIHARATHMLPPPPRSPPHRLFATGAPPPRRTLSERRHHPPPSGELPPSCSIPQSTTASSPR